MEITRSLFSWGRQGAWGEGIVYIFIISWLNQLAKGLKEVSGAELLTSSANCILHVYLN
jgi:hypothetical protein